MARAARKDLIIAYATNSRFVDYSTFVVSARSACPPDAVDIVIYTDAEEPRFADQALQQDVTLVHVQNLWKRTRSSKLLNLYFHANLALTRLLSRRGPASHRDAFASMYHALAEDWIHPQGGRWLTVDRHLSANSSYRFVFLTDLRDVYFQASPFARIQEGTLHVFEQDGIVYGDDNLDTQWYELLYRRKLPERLVGLPALCCGTVLGDGRLVRRLLQLWTEEIKEHRRCAIDQPMFNEVVTRDMDPAAVRRHALANGIVLTVCGDHQGAWAIQDGQVVSADRPVAVIHMYDRDERIGQLVAARTGRSDA